MNWEPTCELRYLERKIGTPLIPESCKLIQVLQQKWQCPNPNYDYTKPFEYDWRDVPVVKEKR